MSADPFTQRKKHEQHHSQIGSISRRTLDGHGLGLRLDIKTGRDWRICHDSVITTKVKAAVLNEPSLKSAEINVETFKGVVQRSGFVSSQADINKAVEVARGVGGVKSVKNDMRLK